MKSLFYFRKIVPTYSNDFHSIFESCNIRGLTNYMDSHVGQSYWQQCKSWKDFKSGPEVNLHLIELISLIFASQLSSNSSIVPVPSSPFDESRPGEISRRIAYRAAHLANVDVIDILNKEPDESISISQFNFIDSNHYVLLDDQLTTGRRIRSCLELLPQQALQDLTVLVWSVSYSRGPWMHLGV